VNVQFVENLIPRAWIRSLTDSSYRSTNTAPVIHKADLHTQLHDAMPAFDNAGSFLAFGTFQIGYME